MKLLLTYLASYAGPLIRIEVDADDKGAKLFDITWGHAKASPVHITSLPQWAQVALAQAIAGVKPIHSNITILD